MEQLCAVTPLAGEAEVDGHSVACELVVKRMCPYPGYPDVIEYNLALHATDTRTSGPFREFAGALADIRNLTVEPGVTTIDVRGYPSHSKTLWRLALTADGRISEARVTAERPFLFDRKIVARFGSGRVARFDTLRHGREQ